MLLIKTVKDCFTDKIIEFKFIEERFCPICGATISPVFISAATACIDVDAPKVSVFNKCQHCHDFFISIYTNIYKSGYLDPYESNSPPTSEPKEYQPKSHEQNIELLSTEFCEIYNQAAQTEFLELNKIAGMGYRKSLEFLVKDYAIHKNPNDSEEIKKMFLSPCIRKYIQDERINVLAEKAAWLGNDEVHYLRKHVDKDLIDLKQLIQAIIYYISMDLIYEDAQLIPKL